MKFIKTVIITLLVMAILFTGIFMAGRYGWKVFGCLLYTSPSPRD